MRTAGIVFRRPPRDAPADATDGARAAYFDDPEGRPLALVAEAPHT
jgi:hypothetical protein